MAFWRKTSTRPNQSFWGVNEVDCTKAVFVTVKWNAKLHFKHGSFFLRANCVWRKRTLHFDDTSSTNMDIALTLVERKFSPAQPFCNRYPRFRIHRSHEYDEEEFFTLFAHPFPTISARFFCLNLTSSCISCVPQFCLNSKADKVVTLLQEKFLALSNPFFKVFSFWNSACSNRFLFQLLCFSSFYIVFKSNLKVKLSCHLHSFLKMFPFPETSKFLE